VPPHPDVSEVQPIVHSHPTPRAASVARGRSWTSVAIGLAVDALSRCLAPDVAHQGLSPSALV